MLPFLRVRSLGRSGRHWASVERERKVGKGKISKKLFKKTFQKTFQFAFVYSLNSTRYDITQDIILTKFSKLTNPLPSLSASDIITSASFLLNFSPSDVMILKSPSAHK